MIPISMGAACGINSTNIVLILEKSGPEDIKEYRLISLLNSSYKLLTKVLTSRLSFKLGNCIPTAQSAFNKGRNISDCYVLAHEIIHECRRIREECLIVKLDYKKAFDSVNWNFLRVPLGPALWG